MATKAQIEQVRTQAEERCRILLRKGKGHEKQVAHLRDCVSAARQAGWKGEAWKALEAEVTPPDMSNVVPTVEVVDEGEVVVSGSVSGTSEA